MSIVEYQLPARSNVWLVGAVFYRAQTV